MRLPRPRAGENIGRPVLSARSPERRSSFSGLFSPSVGDGREPGAIDDADRGEQGLDRSHVQGVPRRGGPQEPVGELGEHNTAAKKAGRRVWQRWKNASGLAWTWRKSGSDPSRIS